MTTSLKAARDQQAEAYATGNHRSSFADTFDEKAFVAGWDACLKELERRISGEFGFDYNAVKQAAQRERTIDRHYNYQDKYTDEQCDTFADGARWQFEQTMKVLRE